MTKSSLARLLSITFGTLTALVTPSLSFSAQAEVGVEKAVPRHLQDGEEFRLPIRDVIDFGQKLFDAVWTVQDGSGRPLTKGNGIQFQIRAPRWSFRAISTACPLKIQTPVFPVTILHVRAEAVTS
ncbi:MAG: hypothetical protein AB7G93_10950 [Bdellovibrionales bacterium]